MDLQSQLALDGIVLLPHDVAPDAVELIEDLRDARLCHLAVISRAYLLDLLYGFRWDPLIGIMVLLELLPRSDFVGLDAELVADLSDALIAQVLGTPHDVSVRNVLVICSLLQ